MSREVTERDLRHPALLLLALVAVFFVTQTWLAVRPEGNVTRHVSR